MHIELEVPTKRLQTPQTMWLNYNISKIRYSSLCVDGPRGQECFQLFIKCFQHRYAEFF